MLDKLKQLAKSSVIYGLGNYGVKLVGFLLIPVYTRYLTPTDYGIMSLVSSYGQFLFIFLNLGQSTALFRFYYDHDTEAGRNRVIAGSLLIALVCSTPLAILALALARPTSQLLLGDATLYRFVMIGIGAVVFRQLLRLPFAVMRADDRDTRYATWSIVRTGLSAGLAILLVVGLEMGVSGVLWSSLLGEALMCAILLPGILGALRVGWAGPEMREQLTYGLAVVPGALAASTLDLADRFLLRHYASVEDVGLYALGHRFGEIIFFIVAAIQLAWPQFIFSNRRAENAPQLYSYATTYYVSGMLFLILGLSMLAPEILAVMAPPVYWPAAGVVPLIALAGLCEGLTYVATVGILLHKRPLVRSASVIVAALINVGLNFVWIPRYGMLGAAWASLIGFVVMATLQVIAALRLYPIAYQWGRLARFAALAAGLYAAGLFVPRSPLVVPIVAKSAMLLAFPVVLWLTGFFERSELAYVGRALASLRGGRKKR